MAKGAGRGKDDGDAGASGQNGGATPPGATTPQPLTEDEKERVRKIMDPSYEVDSFEKLTGVQLSVFLATLAYAASRVGVQLERLDGDGLVRESFSAEEVVTVLSRARNVPGLRRMAKRNFQWYIASVIKADDKDTVDLRDALAELESLVRSVIDEVLTREWAALPLVSAELEGKDPEGTAAEDARDPAAEQMMVRKRISEEKAEKAVGKARKAAVDPLAKVRQAVTRQDGPEGARRCLNPDCDSVTEAEGQCCSRVCEEAVEQLTSAVELSLETAEAEPPARRSGARSSAGTRGDVKTNTPVGLIWSLTKRSTMCKSAEAMELQRQLTTCERGEHSIDLKRIVELSDLLVANYVGDDGPVVDPAMAMRYTREMMYTNGTVFTNLEILLNATPHTRCFLNAGLRDKFVAKVEEMVKERDSGGFMTAGKVLASVMQADFDAYSKRQIKADQAREEKKTKQEEMIKMLSSITAGRGGGRRDDGGRGGGKRGGGKLPGWVDTRYEPPQHYAPGIFRKGNKHERIANKGDTDYWERCYDCGSKRHKVQECKAADGTKKKWLEEGVPAT